MAAPVALSPEQAVAAFNANTRRKIIPMAAITRPSGGGISPAVQLPKTGLAAGLMLIVRGTIGGAVGSVNAFGNSSIVRRVRVQANSGNDLWNISGSGYHWLLKDNLETGLVDILGGQSTAKNAVTATSVVADMWLPFCVNQRDPIGFIMLQNEATILNLTIEWESDATVTSTGTFSNFSVTPYLVNFAVPVDARMWPPLNRIQQVLEDTQTVAAAGEQRYTWQRGGIMLDVVHGLGFGVAGADGFNRFRVALNQSDNLIDCDPNYLDAEYGLLHQRTRPKGVIPFEFVGTSGFGSYGTARDLLNTRRITDLQSIITATGAGTLTTVRRQILPLQKSNAA